ncbi:MAG: hypothetical protein AB8H80_04445 [Planctomycetota bacterium]
MQNIQSPFAAACAAAALLTAAATSTADSVCAQNFVTLPSTAAPAAELSSFELLPFMQPNSRVQMFYGASEVGTLPFLATEMSLRYDGPIPQVGAPGPFAIQQLVIRIGKTAVPTPGAEFDANLTEPLTEVFNGPWTYQPDDGSAFPHPWGGPGDGLTWTFSAPATIVVNPGEWLIVDVQMVGNNIANFGFAHAILDGAETAGGISDGVTTSYGAGCSVATGQPAATAAVEGTAAPGAAHFLTGQNLGANALVLGMFGLDDQNYMGNSLPFALPGTSCELLTSIEASVIGTADANGAIVGETLALSLPADPALNGFVVNEQIASLVSSANAFGIVFSDAVQVTLGAFSPLGADYYMVGHDVDANAKFGNTLRPFGYALRLTTL